VPLNFWRLLNRKLMKIALTGATGFVGRAVVSALASGEHDLSALVRNIGKARLPADVAVARGDLENARSLDGLLRDVDVVVHIAGVIRAVSRAGYFTANESGTRSVAEAALRNRVKRFVHISSLSAREPQLSAYGASKRAGEQVLGKFMDRMSIVILRPPAVYGPGDRATLPLLKALTRRYAVLPGRADARFSLIHVGDLARVIAEAAANNATGIFELDDGKPGGYDWRELGRLASQIEQKTITPIFLMKPVLMALAASVEVFSKMAQKPAMISRDKIRELYHPDWVAHGSGWPLQNPIGFAEGFAATLNWYRQNGWLPSTRAP
jgi:nucleoside-diphosphate-sugar epimerase